MFKNKNAGFYVSLISLPVVVMAFIKFMMWAPAHQGMDILIIIGLVFGFIMSVLTLFREHPIFNIIATGAYSLALVRLLTDSVGSFVDAYQGINMFGDASQVGNILSIAFVMGMGLLLSIIASFLFPGK